MVIVVPILERDSVHNDIIANTAGERLILHSYETCPVFIIDNCTVATDYRIMHIVRCGKLSQFSRIS